ncbi:MAG: helicase-related protein [Cytophagales bacterium]|nr:helicase-related protein [Cytophagales bacterium]
MTEEQERLYDKTKSFYRDVLLKQIKDEGLQKSRFSVLQGLTKLRQLANHPSLCEEGYTGDSGKMEAVLEKLETVLEQHHKVLIFSQFVQHLNLIKKALDERGIAYAYLDGSTLDRKGQVESFQKDDGQSVFLISLKAGGVGLNLTAADYVFLCGRENSSLAATQEGFSLRISHVRREYLTRLERGRGTRFIKLKS